MGYSFLELLGAIVHWLIKGCRTKLSDEIHGNFPATWGRSYDMENLAIGMLVGFILIAIVIILLYYNIIS